MNRQQRRACKLKTAKQDENSQDFQEWQSRNYLRLIKLSIMAEPEWRQHMREQGIDATPSFSKEVFIPELGILYRQNCYPDELKAQFHEWLNEEFFPRALAGQDSGWNAGTQGVSPSIPWNIRILADKRLRQSHARMEALRGQRESVSLAQKAGPFKEPYTVLLLLEAESGETPVGAMKEMKETDEYLVQIGAYETPSRYYSSICEALSILRPEGASF